MATQQGQKACGFQPGSATLQIDLRAPSVAGNDLLGSQCDVGTHSRLGPCTGVQAVLALPGS